MTMFDKLRATQQRVERAEAEQAEQVARRKYEPTVSALERVAQGLAKLQDKQETHALKQRIGSLQRAAAGYVEFEADEAARELAAAAELSQRNEARNRAAVESISAADRETRWRLERGRILAERSRLRRVAEDSGGTIGYLDQGPLPVACPSWFEAPADCVTVTRHHPSVPMPVYNEDGTVVLGMEFDAISGQRPGPELLTPEQQFARAEGR